MSADRGWLEFHSGCASAVTPISILKCGFGDPAQRAASVVPDGHEFCSCKIRDRRVLNIADIHQRGYKRPTMLSSLPTRPR